MPGKMSASLAFCVFPGATGATRDDLRAECEENGLTAVRRNGLRKTNLPVGGNARVRRGMMRMEFMILVFNNTVRGKKSDRVGGERERGGGI